MDFYKKYLKYKMKYLQLKQQMGGDNIANLESMTGQNVTIILGAHIFEPHILNFLRNQPEDINVICIRLNREGIDIPDEVLLVEGNRRLLQIFGDFNDIDLWNLLEDVIFSKGMILKDIIVDWSTAKFFNDSYNYEHGNVMKKIKQFIATQNTKFYIECCLESFFINDDNTKTPMFNRIVNLPDVKIPLRSSIEDGNLKFIEHLLPKIEREFELIYVSDQNQFGIEYPLLRDGEKKITKFIIISQRYIDDSGG